ncbi:MAG: murein biosynthesis integral membrane protein MurJ [Gammaproteobacteria bacterium]
MSGQFIKSTAVVGGLTLVSRLLGFIRDMLIARIFGVDLATDAFFVAFKIPNFLRRLFAEGAFAHAFVPALSVYKEQGENASLKSFVDKTAGSLVLILMSITLVGVIAAPVLILLLAPGFIREGAQYELAVRLLEITFPYLLFISLAGFAGAILNACGKFVVPALTPVFLNLVMIAAAIWLAPLMREPVEALAWGVFAAGIVQLLFQVPPLLRLGLLPAFKWDFKDPVVTKIMRLMFPALFSASVTQINLLLDTLIASFLTIGSVSWLYYSDRLVEFPLGIFGVAVATVILPHLAKHHAAAEAEAFSSALDWGLRLVLIIGLPATAGLILLAEPLLSTLFQYNEFRVSDVHFAGLSLRAYSIGLLGYILTKVLVPGFTSRQDVKTPLRYGIYSMLVSLVLNAVFVFPLAHAGLALATSLGALFNAALLLRKLLRDGVYQPEKDWRLFLFRVIFAAIVMSVVLYAGADPARWHIWGAGDRILHLFQWISIGLVVYVSALLLTGYRPSPVFLNSISFRSK